MTRCPECGERAELSTGPYRYNESGLPNVILFGIRLVRCPKCGYEEVGIPRMAELHRLLASVLVKKRAGLTGPEVRFLRKSLGWSGMDFAAHMGVTAETVSRWENRADGMGAIAERLLRLAVLTRQPRSDYGLELLKIVAQSPPRATEVRLRNGDHGWRPARAA